MKMSQALRDALQSKGWDADRIERYGDWGTEVATSPAHMILRGPEGRERYYGAPFFAVRAGDQAAIVRFG